jgi:D-glycero-alpha-D-manno-heptose-7-phosphate kinase
VWWELERGLVLVFLGKTHSSSAVHEQVIAGLEHEGDSSPRLEALRLTAERSRDAIYTGDFAASGRTMIDNTAAIGTDLYLPQPVRAAGLGGFGRRKPIINRISV